MEEALYDVAPVRKFEDKGPEAEVSPRFLPFNQRLATIEGGLTVRAWRILQSDQAKKSAGPCAQAEYCKSVFPSR